MRLTGNLRAPGGPDGCVLCTGADPARHTPLQDLLATGQSRFIAQTPEFAAFPTLGCFVPGYLLVVPRAHALSFGQLDEDLLIEAHALVEDLAARLEAVYGMPVLGFENGSNTAGARRIEHAHWHLLPSAADLNGWLADRLCGQAVSTLAELPSGTGSYIAVRGQDAAVTVYEITGSVEADRRIRLRRAVAALDPRVDDGAWDWADHGDEELIRATVADLSTAQAVPR